MHPACPGQDLPPNTSALTHALQGISISTAVMLLFPLPLNCNSRDVHIPGLVRDHQFSWHYISAAEGSGESRPYDFFFFLIIMISFYLNMTSVGGKEPVYRLEVVILPAEVN